MHLDTPNCASYSIALHSFALFASSCNMSFQPFGYSVSMCFSLCLCVFCVQVCFCGDKHRGGLGWGGREEEKLTIIKSYETIHQVCTLELRYF